MSLTVASYNLWFHKAYPEVDHLVDANKLDILCIQECFTDDLKPKAGKLALAEAHTYATNPPPIRPNYKRLSSGRVLVGNIGIAMYYNKKRLKLEGTTNFQLPLPWPERKGGRTLQLARFRDVKTGQKIVVGNIHLSALWATNRSRLRQMRAALESIEGYRKKTEPMILAGDFNYPVGLGLCDLLKHHGFAECGQHEKSRTHQSKLVKGKFDRIFISKDLTETDYAILPFGASDHAPVLAKISNL